MSEKPFEIELTAYIDEDSGGVVIAGVCTNTTDGDATFKAMTSGVFPWQVTDDEGRQYIESMGTLQAPHMTTVKPDKSYITVRPMETPEEKVERWQDIEWYENSEIITDPAEIEERDIGGREDVVAAPTIDPELDRELTATLRTRDTDGNEYTEEFTFNPSELEEASFDEMFEEVDVDDGATVSISGRKTDEQDFSQVTTESVDSYEFSVRDDEDI